MTFRVGQEVTLKRGYRDSLNCTHCGGATSLVFGRVYQISKIFTHVNGTIGLRFHEVQPLPNHSGFPAKYFRPVQKRKTDISVFTALLNTKSEKELV